MSPLDTIDTALVDALQDGIEPVGRPFAALATRLGIAERDLVDRVGRLLGDGALSRFGPMFDAAQMGGALTLAALAVPPERFDAVCEQVNAHPEVAHNYARTHRFNMWFVVAAETPARLAAVLDAIAAETGLAVLDAPKLDEYYVGLRLDMARGTATRLHAASAQQPQAARTAPENGAPAGAGRAPAAAAPLDDADRAIVLATQAGLPLDERPFAVLAERVGLAEPALLARVQRMLAAGTIRRIAAVPNHYRLGFTANGMTVWDVDDAAIGELGPRVGALPFVTHCYRRPRQRPDWPYNLFAMIHGRSRDEVEQRRAETAARLGGAARAHDVLYSTRVLKKTGLRLSARRPEYKE